MCDPITMSAVSAGMSYAGGSSLLAGTTLGTGLINAASVINYGSTYGKLGGALSAGAAGLGTTVAKGIGSISTGLNTFNAGARLYGGYQQAKYNRAVYDLEQQKYAYQQEQYKAQRERDAIEARAEELDRRRVFNRNNARNIAMAATSGVQVASTSYKAFLQSNRDQYYRDIDYGNFLSGEKAAITAGQQTQSALAARSSTSKFRTQVRSNIAGTLLDASKLYTG